MMNIGPHPNPDPQADFPAWPWTCLAVGIRDVLSTAGAGGEDTFCILLLEGWQSLMESQL